ncbi:hypothetical protein [Thermofilum sp.]|uniref:hypothetical protein n=1 Tax=Thermofilum sp. TaxID=1961369 RepID=UPI00316599FF
MHGAFIHENELNVRLASVLSESFGLDCRAERVSHRARPDIRCYYNGFRVVIEASYSQSDAEADARRRIEDGLADIAIALHYPEKYMDVPENELKNRLQESAFNAMIIVPSEIKNLEEYILGKTRVAKLIGGWFTNIKLGDLADIIKHSMSYLMEEAEVKQEVERVKMTISGFTKTASSLPGSDKLRNEIAEALYKLYGFEIAETRDAEVVFGQAALTILLSSILYERVRHFHGLPHLADYVKSRGPINGLREAFNSLLKVDYEPALALTVDVLGKLPPSLGQQVNNIVGLALQISETTSLLARDFAGRVYHEIAGDIAVRKGFATFYTEIPAAYMLSNLAIKTLLDVGGIEKLDKDKASSIINTLCKLKIADFACGSGTLLTASLYNASRLARNICFLHNLDFLCKEQNEEKGVSVEKTLIERGIYGLDALRYASQIAALNLALMAPESITKENISAVYLGVRPDKKAWLGSLELLDNVKAFGGILRWIEGGLRGAVESVSTIKVISGKLELLDKYDIVIMNPPFSRATGRISKEYGEGRKGLFGFITDEKSRKIVRERYNEVRERARDDLMKIARELIEKEPILQFYKMLFREPGGGREESSTGLDQYLSIGQAGEGLLFLYLAYRYVKPGGVIAFVLPKNLLSGVSWFLARMLLANKFHLRYVIISSNAKKGYNFSENASLSECLIIAKRTDEHRSDEGTTFVNLLRKPKSALEAILLSEKILLSEDSLRVSSDRKERLVELSDGAIYIVQRIPRPMLLENIDNWNRLVFLPELDVIDFGFKILKGDLGVMGIKVPMIRLNDLITNIGIDRHQFHDNFSRVYTETQYPILYGGEEEVREKMLVKPNAYASPKHEAGEEAKELYEQFSARVLLPDRFPLTTTHVTALFSETPALSNIFYAVRLKEGREEDEKALVYWLNTTWGLLSIIASREETGGPWMSLKMAQWRMLPVLEVSKLDDETLKKLSNAFDRLCRDKPKRIVEQFSTNPAEVDPIRLKIDLEFLKSLNPNIDEVEAKKQLYEIYKKIAIAFKRLIQKS